MQETLDSCLPPHISFWNFWLFAAFEGEQQSFWFWSFNMEVKQWRMKLIWHIWKHISDSAASLWADVLLKNKHMYVHTQRHTPLKSLGYHYLSCFTVGNTTLCGGTQLTAGSTWCVCVCVCATRVECESGLQWVHSVYGETVAAARLHKRISLTHTNSVLSANKQVSTNRRRRQDELSCSSLKNSSSLFQRCWGEEGGGGINHIGWGSRCWGKLDEGEQMFLYRNLPATSGNANKVSHLVLIVSGISL